MGSRKEVVMLSQGSGGQAMRELIEDVFIAAYGDAQSPRDDSAVLSVPECDLAFTTDSFVVDPMFFPGGDIGRLAVAGTVNDILTAGARPIAISASFIIEEGLDVQTLRAVADSMRDTAREANVQIVTGDTKVVARRSADKLFITTSGIGVVLRPGISGGSARAGDRVILTGSIADHGMAVMLAREGLLESEEIESDVAPLTEIVTNLLEAGCEIHAMRDPTRGGIGSALNEIAVQSGVCVEIDENAVKVNAPVRAACEALGIDPFYVANEGKMLVFVAPKDATRAVMIVRACRHGEDAQIIGEVRATPPGRVQVRTSLGTARLLPVPSGELLPRIC